MNATIFDVLFLQQPEPDADTIRMQQQMDRNRNPHNDPHKPPIRNVGEIIGDVRAERARLQLCQLAMAKLQHKKEIEANGGFATISYLADITVLHKTESDVSTKVVNY